ncbi:MAG: dTDP-glucose 4,6-dehydratase [bacterium]
MKTVLVTGGAGFIGSNFIRYMLKKHDYSIINIDKLTYAGNLDNLNDIERDKRYEFIRGDICDRDVVDDVMRRVDSVVNFAAETHVDRSILDAGDFVKTDVYGVYRLLEAARVNDVERFVHISTDEVYGDAGDEPSREDSPLMPRSPYAASKAGGDRVAFSYWATYGVPVIITRCSNNMGPYQYPEKLIPLFVTNAIEGKSLPVYGTGRNTRDWIYVEDHCEAVDLTLHAPGECNGDVFNIGASAEKSVLQIAGLILEILGKGIELIEHVDDRLGHVKRHAVNTEKIRKTLDWKPKYDFREGIEKTVNWYVDNESWWRKIKDKQREYIDFMKKYYK